jgi:hypothetical protein
MVDEDRHADEVNIAFQMGAEWQKKQSESAWRGIHEGAVLAMQGRIKKLETALTEVIDNHFDSSCVCAIARKALGGKDGN